MMIMDSLLISKFFVQRFREAPRTTRIHHANLTWRWACKVKARSRPGRGER